MIPVVRAAAERGLADGRWDRMPPADVLENHLRQTAEYTAHFCNCYWCLKSRGLELDEGPLS